MFSQNWRFPQRSEETPVQFSELRISLALGRSSHDFPEASFFRVPPKSHSVCISQKRHFWGATSVRDFSVKKGPICDNCNESTKKSNLACETFRPPSKWGNKGTGEKKLWTHSESARAARNTPLRPNASRNQYLYIVDFVHRHLYKYGTVCLEGCNLEKSLAASSGQK